MAYTQNDNATHEFVIVAWNGSHALLHLTCSLETMHVVRQATKIIRV